MGSIGKITPASAFLMIAFARITHGEPLEPLVPLTQDLSRGALGEMAARLANPEEVETLGLGPPFVFPNDLKKTFIYGIDISHHTFANHRSIDWKGLTSVGVSFVYMKATEGSRFVDVTLQDSWPSARKAGTEASPIYAGAFHFLSADVDPVAQAQTFLRVLREKTDFVAGRDMPPAVDLEQDCWKDAAGHTMRDAKGNCVGDYWSKYSPEQIISKVALWTSTVQSALKVKPIVYTNAQWWKSVHLGDNSFLKDNLIWIADYSRKAQSSGTPAVPPSYSETIWQFTDNGKIDASCDPSDKQSECFDSNVVRLDREAFKKAVGISKQ